MCLGLVLQENRGKEGRKRWVCKTPFVNINSLFWQFELRSLYEVCSLGNIKNFYTVNMNSCGRKKTTIHRMGLLKRQQFWNPPRFHPQVCGGKGEEGTNEGKGEATQDKRRGRWGLSSPASLVMCCFLLRPEDEILEHFETVLSLKLFCVWWVFLPLYQHGGRVFLSFMKRCI